jgi:hypothetical protein
MADNKNVQLKNNKTTISSEERKLAAKAVVDASKEHGLQVTPTKDGYGGFVSLTNRNGDRVTSTTSDIQWMVGSDGYVHIAGVIPDNLKPGYTYLQDAKEYDTIENADRKQLIALSRKAVRYEGVVNSSIEALVEIPTLGGWFIYCTNPELEKLLYYWAKNFGSIGDEEPIETSEYNVQKPSGIELFTLNMLWTMYRDGDAVITERWDNVKVDEVGGKRRNLPVGYIEHDVASCEIPEIYYKMGREFILAEPDQKINEVLSGEVTETEKPVLEKIPDSLKESYNNLDKYDGKVLLPGEFTTHFSRKSDNRSPWGIPYVVKAFAALAFKHRLRDLDIATVDGLIQRVWIVKVGNDDVESPMHVPDNDRVLLAISMFKQLQANNFAVWGGSDLSTEEFGSSEKNILSLQDRYKSADDDIRIALGVPKVLLTGEGSGSSRDYSVYVKVIAQMERYQIMIKKWIDHKMRQIAIENGYKDQFPTFHWMMLKTQDQEKAKNIITKAWENSLMGRRMTLNYLGFPHHMIIEDQQREKEEKLNDTIEPNNIPFTDQQGRPDDTRDGDGDGDQNKKPKDDSNRDNQKD